MPDGEDRWRILDDLRQSVQFTAVNLVDPAETRQHGRFDVIFCRNVLIYFDDASRRLAAENLYRKPRAGRLHLPGPHRVHEPHLAAVRGAPLRRCDRLSAAAGRRAWLSAAGKRILVVDDASLVRRYYRDALERAGFEVDEALNGLEALEKLLASRSDLLIVDVNMPQMDGLTFLQALRRQALAAVVACRRWSSAPKPADRMRGGAGGRRQLLPRQAGRARRGWSSMSRSCADCRA